MHFKFGMIISLPLTLSIKSLPSFFYQQVITIYFFKVRLSILGLLWLFPHGMTMGKNSLYTILVSFLSFIVFTLIYTSLAGLKTNTMTI